MSLYRAIEIWSKTFHEVRPTDLAIYLGEEGFPVVIVDCGVPGDSRDTIYQLGGFVYIRGNNQIVLTNAVLGSKTRNGYRGKVQSREGQQVKENQKT